MKHLSCVKLHNMNNFNKWQDNLLNKPTESNKEWAMQQILAGMSKHKRKLLYMSVKEIYEHLYKSWARDLTINDLYEICHTLKTNE